MTPSLQIHVQRRAHAERGAGSTATASRSASGGLRSRVREALCCPYCHESLRPEELRAHPTQHAVYRSTAADVLGLAAVSSASLLGYLAQPSSVLLSALALATCLVVPAFLVLRNLCTLALPRTGLGELVREAWSLALRGERTAAAHGEALSCARLGCGAVYHAECWKECTTSYGACAVFACGSRDARNLSRTQLHLRSLRLLLAAFLFSQRLIDSVTNSESNSNEVVHMRQAIRVRATRLHDVMWGEDAPGRSGLLRGLASLVQLLVAIGGVAFGFWVGIRCVSFGSGYLVICGLGLPIGLALAFYGSTWVAVLGLYAAKSLLSSEFSALTRLGQRGAFLSRASSKK